MELTVSFMRVKQPNCAATSPMTAVQTPIAAIDTTKQGQPCILSEQGYGHCKVVIQNSKKIFRENQGEERREEKEREEKKRENSLY